MPPSSRKRQDPPPPTPLDPKEIRQHVRLLIRHLASVHLRDTPRQTQVILNEIWRLVVYATLQLQHGEPAQALPTLQAVTDVCTTQGMHLNDIHSEVSTFFQDLASARTEVLLLIDLTKRTFAHHSCKFGTGEDSQIEDAVRSCNPCERGLFYSSINV